MDKRSPRVSIIILVQHKADLLLDCLRSLRSSTIQASYELLVVFNGTPSSEIERVREEIEDLTCLTSRVNLGFSGGNNFAVRRARGEFFVFLNDDTIPEEGWLDALVDAADRTPQAGAVGSRILFPNGTLQEAGCIIWDDGSTYPMGRGEPPRSRAFCYPRYVDYCSANALLVRAETFRQGGGFDEGFFPAYYEDVDLCLTIRHRLHQKILYEPRSRIRHFEAASSESTFRAFLFRRNVGRIRRKWERELAACEAAAPSSFEAIERACYRARESSARVLVIDDRIPNAGLGSGFGRLGELVSDLSGTDYAVSFFGTAMKDDDPTTLEGAGIELVAGDLAEHLAQPQRRYDVIVISRPHNYERFVEAIHRFQPQAKLVYDAEALFHRRLFMQADLESDPEEKSSRILEAQKMLALEKRVAKVCSRMVCISVDEETVLNSFEGHCPIELLVPLASGIEFGRTPFGDREGIIFVAGWLAGDQSPNVPALKWFVEKVFPHVRDAVPNASVRVSGKNPSSAVTALASANVHLTGFVEDIDAFYDSARVAIAPLTYGAGVKIKTIEAIQHGVPVVATPVGAEGLGLTDGNAIDIAISAPEFALRVVRLLTDRETWEVRRNAMTLLLGSLECKRVRWSDIIGRTLAEIPNHVPA
jgi:GT2 family glycosyltransferase